MQNRANARTAGRLITQQAPKLLGLRTHMIFLQVLGQPLLSLVDPAVDAPITLASIAFTLVHGMLREIRWV